MTEIIHLLLERLENKVVKGDITVNQHCLRSLQCFQKPSSPVVAWKEYCAEHWFKELQESMDMYPGLCDITEILLKIALNTMQSISLLQGDLKSSLTLYHTIPTFNDPNREAF